MSEPIVFFSIGDTAQLIITAFTSEGSFRPLPSEVEWETSGAAVAVVDTSRLLTTTAYGMGTLRAIVHGTPSNDLEIRVAKFLQLSSGQWTACGRTDIAGSYCWGSGSAGVLGTGVASADAVRPVSASAIPDLVIVVVGAFHACGLDADGAAYCWGEGGRLGTADADPSTVPRPVSGMHSFQSISVGRWHTCGLTHQGDVYCWGELTLEPELVGGGFRFQTIDVGDLFTCGVTDTGVGQCWGSNQWFGNLGTGSTTTEWVSEPQPLAGGLRYTSIGAGAEGGCGVTTGGSVMCWGNDVGPTPAQVPLSGTYTRVEMGGEQTCAVRSDGAVYCRYWDPIAPTWRLVALPGNLKFEPLTVGASAACGVTVVDVRCWGSNSRGTLGIGSQFATWTLEPLQVVRP